LYKWSGVGKKYNKHNEITLIHIKNVDEFIKKEFINNYKNNMSTISIKYCINSLSLDIHTIWYDIFGFCAWSYPNFIVKLSNKQTIDQQIEKFREFTNSYENELGNYDIVCKYMFIDSNIVEFSYSTSLDCKVT
jgi:hypothetical protein